MALFFANGRGVSFVQATLQDTVWETPAVVLNDPVVKSLTIGFEDGLVAHIGQGCGAMTCLSKADGQLELFSDGHQMLRAGRSSAGDPYLRKYNTSVDSGPLSGSQGPIAMLAGALQGDALCIKELKSNMADFLIAQQICFAALVSDSLHGQRVPLDSVPSTFEFLAKTGDLYA